VLIEEQLERPQIKKRVLEPWGGEPPPELPDLPFGPEDNGRDDAEPQPRLNNALVGMMLFLAADFMFFVALIGAFLVFRGGSTMWPPPGQPRLPIAVTGVNTLILLASGFTMMRAMKLIRASNARSFMNHLMITAALGATFLLIQGSEWTRLVGFGLTMSSSVYGSIFYTLIGCHALHVLGAVLWLVVINLKARRLRFTAENHIGVQLCAMYWFLVVGLWPVLYAVVYLN
jgi:heme/copper-type cytochrome/quinol oxidase subunit 3